MNSAELLDLLLQANQLKLTARTGWVQRGVPAAENVAAHTFGVAFTALALAQIIAEPVALDRVLAMALLHDLPESLTSDIPSPAWRFLPPGVKLEAERSALAQILGRAPFAPAFQALWEELHQAVTAEARLVHDADRIDLLVQAWQYERQSQNRRLAEFWTVEAAFHFPEAAALYELLRQRRSGAAAEEAPGAPPG
jgi:putative hydrolase of HD superfamily